MFNPLNDVNGNTMAWMAEQDRESGTSHQDQYYCGQCGDIITFKRHESCELCPECEENEIMGDKFGGI